MQQVLEAAAESIQLPDHQHVAGAKLGQRLKQRGTLPAGTCEVVFKQPLATRRFQGRSLWGGGLGIVTFADTHVAELHCTKVLPCRLIWQQGFSRRGTCAGHDTKIPSKNGRYCKDGYGREPLVKTLTLQLVSASLDAPRACWALKSLSTKSEGIAVPLRRTSITSSDCTRWVMTLGNSAQVTRRALRKRASSFSVSPLSLTGSRQYGVRAVLSACNSIHGTRNPAALKEPMR